MRFLQAHLSSTATGPLVCCHCKPESALCHIPQATAGGDEQGRARPESCRLHVSSTAHQVQCDPWTTTLQGQLSNWFFSPTQLPTFPNPNGQAKNKNTAGKRFKLIQQLQLWSIVSWRMEKNNRMTPAHTAYSCDKTHMYHLYGNLSTLQAFKSSFSRKISLPTQEKLQYHFRKYWWQSAKYSTNFASMK